MRDVVDKGRQRHQRKSIGGNVGQVTVSCNVASIRRSREQRGARRVLRSLWSDLPAGPADLGVGCKIVCRNYCAQGNEQGGDDGDKYPTSVGAIFLGGVRRAEYQSVITS